MIAQQTMDRITLSPVIAALDIRTGPQITIKKYLFAISLLFLKICFAAETMLYDSEYQGLKVGQSSIDDMLKKFGKPHKITNYGHNIHYHFKHLKVTALAATGKVHTIAIRDENYIDVNGIKVRLSTMVLEATLKKKTTENYLADTKAGIVYWLKDNKVETIVLAHE